MKISKLVQKSTFCTNFEGVCVCVCVCVTQRSCHTFVWTSVVWIALGKVICFINEEGQEIYTPMSQSIKRLEELMLGV